MATIKTVSTSYATKATAVRGAKRLNERFVKNGQFDKSADVEQENGVWFVVESYTAVDEAPVLDIDTDLVTCVIEGSEVAPIEHVIPAAPIVAGACPLCGAAHCDQTWHNEGVSLTCHSCAKVYSVTTGKEIIINTTTRTNRSTCENPTKTVWRIADSMKGSRRKDIIAACEAAGIAYYTARTQYQYYVAAVKEQEANTKK